MAARARIVPRQQSSFLMLQQHGAARGAASTLLHLGQLPRPRRRMVHLFYVTRVCSVVRSPSPVDFAVCVVCVRAAPCAPGAPAAAFAMPRFLLRAPRARGHAGPGSVPVFDVYISCMRRSSAGLRAAGPSGEQERSAKPRACTGPWTRALLAFLCSSSSAFVLFSYDANHVMRRARAVQVQIGSNIIHRRRVLILCRHD